MNMKKTFETSDFILVATLHSLNYKFEQTERDVRGRVNFFFSKDTHLDAVIEKYQNGELRIEPQKFAYSQKFLKTIIHSK